MEFYSVALQFGRGPFPRPFLFSSSTLFQSARHRLSSTALVISCCLPHYSPHLLLPFSGRLSQQMIRLLLSFVHQILSSSHQKRCSWLDVKSARARIFPSAKDSHIIKAFPCLEIRTSSSSSTRMSAIVLAIFSTDLGCLLQDVHHITVSDSVASSFR